MDKLIEKIIEKTELKNWTLFLFIFAICYAKGLQIITGKWFHLPDENFNQTTLFLLEVFLSSLTITRILVAIKFLEAINRTPIIADFINWVVVERRRKAYTYEALTNESKVTGVPLPTTMGWTLEYTNGITELEAWRLIHYCVAVEGSLPHYNNLKKAIDNKMKSECVGKVEIGVRIALKLNPAIYRHLDREKYGKWLQKRPLCLEHIILILFLAGAIDLYLVYIYYSPFFPFIFRFSRCIF